MDQTPPTVSFSWDTTPPFSVEWYNGTFPQGLRTLTAKAYGAAGHVSAPATVTVIIDHVKPGVSISSPANEALVRGTVQLTASAGDANGIRAVSFYDGPVEFNGLIGYAAAAPYTAIWNTLNTYNGRRGLRAVATDRAGNLSRRQSHSGCFSASVSPRTLPQLWPRMKIFFLPKVLLAHWTISSASACIRSIVSVGASVAGSFET